MMNFSSSRRHFLNILPTVAAMNDHRVLNRAALPDNMAIDSIDVRRYGARGDGVADDSSAINRAIEDLRHRQARVRSYSLGCRLIFPTGVYMVESSLNLTLLQTINMVIEGQGSVLVGCTKGAPVLDAFGTRWLMIRDLTIIGDKEAMPSIGLQLGVVSADVVADDHSISNLKILGNFGRACFYNRGAETSYFEHLLLWNSEPEGYCLIQDGTNFFDIKSSFVEVSLPVDSDLSFNENVFVNCDFRHGSGGTPVWLGDTARHAFVRCYAATDTGPSFIVYCGRNSQSMLHVDCHCETAELGSVFRFQSIHKRIIIRGFDYKDHQCFAKINVFTADEFVDEIEIQNLCIEIPSYYHATCVVFDSAKHWSVIGSYYSSESSQWNGQKIFKGALTLGSNMQMLGVFIAPGTK